MRPIKNKAKVVDLFSGIGGLSYGFVLEGFKILAGFDTDESCRYGFEKNNRSRFVHKDIAAVTAEELKKLYRNCPTKILIGCAPCAPFSTLNLKRSLSSACREERPPLGHFLRLITTLRPEIVSMENVPALADREKFPIFERFLKTIKKNGYHVSHIVVDASRYGVPQRRRRLVLLASRYGPISLVPETHTHAPITVRQSIADLPRLEAGQRNKLDPLHRASKLSALNMRRIRATPRNGGSATSWRRELLPKCFRKRKGKSYRVSVYGRMSWDRPAPTMTTTCNILGTGRFGHPRQNRAISLREAARFQTFPDSYRFHEPHKLKASVTARHIGNAVPVKLARAIAISVRNHIVEYRHGRTKS